MTNIGGETGSYTVKLKVAGVTVDSETVTLAGGESTPVTFKVVKDVAGTYSVEVDGQTGTFEVREAVAPPTPVEAWLSYIGVAVATIAILTIVALLVKRRRSV